MRFIIKESILFEDKASDIREKYYSDIAEERFRAIVSLDPTTITKNDNIEKIGDYSKWLLNLHKNNKLKDNGEDDYKAKEYLDFFHKIKSKLEPNDKNIFKYKSLPELFDTIKPFLEKPEEELQSKSQIEKKIKENETEKFYEDSEWLVVIPKTERASCIWGKNTQWCTAATKAENRFNNYNNRGPLYIFIDKQNNKKYQLHFETTSLNDESDSPVDIIEFFGDLNNSLYEKFVPILLNYAEYNIDNYCIDNSQLFFTDNGFLVYTIDESATLEDEFPELTNVYENVIEEINETEFHVSFAFNYIDEDALDKIKSLYSKYGDLKNVNSLSELEFIIGRNETVTLNKAANIVFQKMCNKYAKKIVKNKFLNIVPYLLDLRKVISDEKGKKVFMSNDGFEHLVRTAFNSSYYDMYQNIDCIIDVPEHLREDFYSIPDEREIIKDSTFLKSFGYTLYRFLAKRMKQDIAPTLF